MSKIGHNNPPIDVPEHITDPVEYLRFLVRFTAVPTVVKAVGHELCCCMNSEGFCSPSGKELMANTGIKDKRTMTEALRIIEHEIGIMVERTRGTNSQFTAPKVGTSNAPGYHKVGASNVGTSNAPSQKVGTSNAYTSPKVGTSNAPTKEGKGGTIGGVGEIQRFSTGSPTKKQPHQNNIDQIKKSDREIVVKKIRWTRQKIDGLFEEFWQQVPAGRKIGKPKSRALFEKLIKGKRSGLDEVKPQDLIEGMRRFKKATERDKTELQFIPHPTTWLNDGRWMDESENGNGKPWGWWRERGPEAYRQLGADWWRDKITKSKPNGLWPWPELGPPPGHPECLLPDEANKAYGDKYAEQVQELIKQHGDDQ